MIIWLSSQLWIIYITALIKAMVLLTVCWFLGSALWLAAGLALLVLAAQILAAILALRATPTG